MQCRLLSLTQKNHYNQIQNILKNPENFTPGPLPESPHIIDTPRRDIVFQIMQQVWIHVAKSKLGSKFLLHCWEVSRRGYPTEKSEIMKNGCTRLVLGEAFSVAHWFPERRRRVVMIMNNALQEKHSLYTRKPDNPGRHFFCSPWLLKLQKNMTLTPRGELIVGFVSALLSPLLEWPQPTGITWVKEISGQELMGK